MELWGIPFILIGAHMLVGRFFVDKWQRARTTYGLTSQRVIIVSELFRRSIKSLNLRTLADVSLTERPDGSGTITFGSEAAEVAQSGPSASRHERRDEPCVRSDSERTNRL